MTGRRDVTRRAVNFRPELALRSQVGDPADEAAHREGPGVVHIHGEIVINRPPGQGFDVVAETGKDPEYDPRSLSSTTYMSLMDLHTTLLIQRHPASLPAPAVDVPATAG